MKPSYLSTIGALFTSLALLGSAAAQDPIADIRHTPSTITIDGVADEAVWGSANEYTNFEHAASEPPDDEADLSAKWRALWDEENLYFFIEVTDDATVLDDNNDWQDDSVEIYIDAEALSRTGDEPVDDYRPGEWPIYQLTVLAGSNMLHNGVNHAAWGELNPDAELETGEVGGNEVDFYPLNGVGVIDGTNYSLEVALPWASLGDISPDAILDRGLFGLGFAVNDDDDEEGRDHQIMWGTSNGDLWMSAVQFPSVQLLVPEGPGPDIFVRSKSDLGQLSASETTHSRTVEIRNVGTENALMVTGVTVTGPDADTVTIDEQPSMIEPSGVGEIKYTLTPGRTGDFQFGFEIATNDVDADDQTKTINVTAAIINNAGPAAHFAMDDAVGSTEMRDITGYGRHGTYSGGTLGQDALATGNAVLFNGSEFGTITTDDLNSDQFTVSLWLDGAEVGGTQLVIGQGDGNPIFGLLLQGGAPAWFADGGVEFVAEGAAVAAGEKRLLSATYDGTTSTVVLYLDGVAVATQENAAEVQLGSGEPWSIGSFGGVLGFNGIVDDVQIYTRVLSAEEVQGLFDVPGSVPSAFAGGELPNGAVAGDADMGGKSGLAGYYWNVGVKEVPTSGEPMHREGDGPDGADTANSGWADNNVFNKAITGSFDATTFEYAGNDLTPIAEWLGADAASYQGVDGNLDDGVFRFVGYVYAADPGPRTIDFNAGSDDGAVVYIGDEAVVENDNGHGEGDPVSGTYNFPAQGFYPIDIRYFNGDWTNDAGDHGGANFRNNTLADLTLFQTVEGVEPFFQPEGAGPSLPEGAIPGGPELAGAAGLSGYYWNVGVKEVPTSGEPMHREGDGPDGADTANSGWADNTLFNSVPTTGQFDATTFEYAGNDLTPISEWLGADAASYSGDEGNLDDGVFRMVGYVYVPEAGEQTITFNAGSDDGAVVYIADQAVVENDNGHGEGDPVSGTYDFPAEGYYPIDIRYFNGDWTNDAGDHGGANFRNNTLADLTLVQGVEGVAPFYKPVPASVSGYANNFTYDDGTTDLGDGSVITSNDGTNSVQGGALQMTLAGTNSTAASFVLPPMDASAGWTASFDFVIEHIGENTPADGFSFNYGAIPEGENFGDPAEEGYGAAAPHVSFQVDTWLWNDADGQDAGVGIEVTGTEIALTKATDDNANFMPNERVEASATLSWDPANGASFTTTGLRTNADFTNIPTGDFAAEAGYGFSFLARTGGHNETLLIDNLVVTPNGGGPAPEVDLLVNGSFEDPAVDNINANNLGVVPTGWSQTGADATWNVIRNDGTPYDNGVDTAADGSQVLDLNGIFEIFQNFTLTEAADVRFGASFANRSGHDGADPSTVGIYDAAGTTLLSPEVSVDTSADPQPSEVWATGEQTVSLAPGEYQIRIALNNWNNMDAVYAIASAPKPGIEGLLGYWRFEEGAGEVAADSSGNGNDGEIIAADGVWENDPALGSVYHSNDASYINFGTIVPAQTTETDFTWSFWVNADETDNNDIVFGNRWGPDGNDFAPREFIKFTPRAFEWHFDGGGENVPGDNTMLPVGEWVHNIVVKSGTTLTYYRNGAEIASSAITGTPVNPQPLYIGGQANAAGDPAETFSGSFDEAALFGRALSADEVTEVYNRGLNGESLSGPTGGGGDAGAITNVTRAADGSVTMDLPAGNFDIQYSVDLIDWSDIATGISGSFEDSDAARTALPEGFYRAVQK